MQISRDIIKNGIAAHNRKAFLAFLRLKMLFPHGWANVPNEELAIALSKCVNTVIRYKKQMINLGLAYKTPTGVFFLRNINSKKFPHTAEQKRLIKKGLLSNRLSTVRLTMEMCDEEIFAHLTLKIGADYIRKCDYMYRVKEDNEQIGKNKKLKHFKNVKTVLKIMKKSNPVNPLPNKKIVISDKKMSAKLGLSISDFRRRVKPYWFNLGLLSWSSTRVQLNFSQQEIKYGNLPKGVFVHKGFAYAHTTQYHDTPKL